MPSLFRDKILELYDKATVEIEQKEYIIKGLQEEIETLKKQHVLLEAKTKNSHKVIYPSLAKDAKIIFSDLEYFGLAKMLESKDFIKVDTVSVVSVKWNKKLSANAIKQKEKELDKWLRDKLKTNKLLFIEEKK